MSVPQDCDSSSDISSNSSWTILNENELQETENRVDSKKSASKNSVSSIPPDADSVVEPTENSNADLAGNRGSTSSMDSLPEAVETEERERTKEEGFLTLEELMQERELERDYAFDQNHARHQNLLNESKDRDKNKRKKSKAACVGTLSIISTVLAITGMSILCLLSPVSKTALKNSAPTSKHSIANSFSGFKNIPNATHTTFPVYRNSSDDSLNVADDKGVLRKLLDESCCKAQNNESHFRGHLKLNESTEESTQPLLPRMSVRRILRQAALKNLKLSKNKQHSIQEAVPLVGPIEQEASEVEDADSHKGNEKNKPSTSSFSIQSSLATQICQDVVLLRTLNSLHKMRSFKKFEKIVKEKRKQSKKDTSRKLLRLMKVAPADSSSCDSYMEDLERRRCRKRLSKRSEKQGTGKKRVREEESEGMDKAKVKHFCAKTNATIRHQDFMKPDEVRRKRTTKQETVVDSRPILTNAVSTLQKNEPKKANWLQHKKVDSNCQNGTKIRTALSKSALNPRDLGNFQQNLKPFTKKASSTSGLTVASEQKYKEIMKNINQVKGYYDTKLNKFNEQLRKALELSKCQEKINDISSSFTKQQGKTRDASTGFYKMPDIENFKARLEALRNESRDNKNVALVMNFVEKGERKSKKSYSSSNLKRDTKPDGEIKVFLQSVIDQAVREVEKDKQDATNKEDSSAYSSGSETYIPTTFGSRAATNKPDALYRHFFGNKAKEIEKMEHKRLMLEERPKSCLLRQLSKHDPKKCYVPKVSYF